jgi:membrane protein implicated in regulation of membrane protease activity
MRKLSFIIGIVLFAIHFFAGVDLLPMWAILLLIWVPVALYLLPVILGVFALVFGGIAVTVAHFFQQGQRKRTFAKRQAVYGRSSAETMRARRAQMQADTMRARRVAERDALAFKRTV